jgi:hypothetical protein
MTKIRAYYVVSDNVSDAWLLQTKGREFVLAISAMLGVPAVQFFVPINNAKLKRHVAPEVGKESERTVLERLLAPFYEETESPDLINFASLKQVVRTAIDSSIIAILLLNIKTVKEITAENIILHSDKIVQNKFAELVVAYIRKYGLTMTNRAGALEVSYRSAMTDPRNVITFFKRLQWTGTQFEFITDVPNRLTGSNAIESGLAYGMGKFW